MKKKVLYIWKGSYPWDVRTAKFCNTLAKNNYEVHLLARWSGEELEREILDNINIHRVGFKRSSKSSLPIPFNPVWISSIKNKIHEISPDLIIVREIILAEDAGKLARKNNIPVLMDMAENYPAAMRDWKKYNANKLSKFMMHDLKIPDKVEKRALKYMDKVIIVCEEQIQRLNDEYNYPKKNITIVHNTPDKDIFEIQEVNNNDKIVIGHHGYLTAEKSIKNLILGFMIAYKTRQDIELQIWGDGECYEDYKQMIDENCSPEAVILKGKYEYSNLNEIINGFDVGAIPYQISNFNNYTIHNKIFDYFACKKPVIVSEAKPLKRIVNETHSGYVVNCEEPGKLAEFIISLEKEKLKEMGEKGYKAFDAKYNWEVDEEVLLKTVKELI